MSGQLPRWRRVVGSQEMASCLEVGSGLQRYLDGEVDEVTARRVARHLEACRRCGLEASTYAEIKAALAARSDDVPEDAVARLRRFGEQLMDGEFDVSDDKPDASGEIPG